MLSPDLRRLLALLDALPQRLGAVHVLALDPRRPGRFDGEDQHRHSVPTLVACLQAPLRLESAGRRWDLASGDVAVIAPGVWHRHAPLRPGAATLGMGVRTRFCDVVLAGPGVSFWGSVPREPAARRLAEAAVAPEAGRRAAVLAVLDLLLGERLEPLERDPPAVERMLGRLWGNLDSGLGAADLVAASGLGRSQAYALFTAAEGVSPRRAVEQERLRLAEALDAAGLAPADIARAVGFPDAAALQRVRRRSRGRV
ncbi:MAG: hypothetical protein RLZZ127_381 [Planctomycetota bacterium]|jgi:AraC-like DNA-binding protein